MKSGRIFALVALVAVLSGVTSCANPSKAAVGDYLIRVQLATARLATEHGHFETAFSSLEPAMEPALYSQLSPSVQYEVAQLYGVAAQRQGAWSAAHHAFVLATANSSATPNDWDRRLYMAILDNDGPDAFAMLQQISKQGRGVLGSYPAQLLDHLDQLLGGLPNSQEARLELGRRMEIEDWQSFDADYDPSNIWLHYVAALLDAGHVKKATEVASRITNPMVMMAMHADRRFDGVIAGNPSLTDPEAAAERYLKWTRGYAAANPKVLGGQVAVARALAILNRSDEALAILDDASRALGKASALNRPFDDMEQTRELEAWRTSLLASLGRADEALGSRTNSALHNTSPGAAVPLARTLVGMGRASEARRWLEQADPNAMDPRYRVELASLKACASAQLEDFNQLKKDLDVIRGQESINPGSLVTALVCANDLDAAASVLARQIRNPVSRLQALSSLQTYGSEPKEPKFDAVLHGRWKILATKPVVLAEVAKVGRISRYRLLQWEWL